MPEKQASGGGNGMGYREFHHEWVELATTLAKRDKEVLAVLEETRDSLGAMQTRFESLPCDVHNKRLDSIERSLACLAKNSIPWRGIITRKTIAAGIAAGAGLVGWDGLKKMIENWGR